MIDKNVALYRPDQVADLDRYAIGALGIPGLQLMERAGAHAYAVLRQRWPERRRLAVFCGAGNNGGDGYVIAELARRDGLQVDVVHLVPADRLRGDAATVARRYLDAGGRCRAYDGGVPEGAELIVDALLGTGLDRAVEGPWAQAIDTINQHRSPVLAVDIPSGLSGDSGAVMGTAVCADVTATFIGLKRGLYTGDGPGLSGDIRFFDLDVPDAVYGHRAPAARLVRLDALSHRLPPRDRTGHKGHYGHVLVVGGHQGMGGAALMAGRAALRVGAGLVSVATHPAHAASLLGAQPELMIRGVRQARELEPMLRRASVIVLGPGLGQDDWGQGLFRRVLDSGLPCLLDADALNLLSQRPMHREDWVLTPHPGEAGRLLAQPAAAVQRHRFEAVEALVERYRGAVVLKGAGTLVAAPEETISVCPQGNPGMATGGTGDVLSGVIGGLMAQGLPAFSAAELGVCLHAAAGDLAALRGERGMAATDLIPHLRRLVNPCACN
ncbi:MAG: NAD(P)H-hydrate dehydratase [Ectothiorhodospiraceae bacterium]|nr:NAD(P)H-hydrate dehydratase [Ectothiorhodospiraceae bacterium]